MKFSNLLFIFFFYWALPCNAQWSVDTTLTWKNNPPAINTMTTVDSSVSWMIGYYYDADSAFIERRTRNGWSPISIDDIRTEKPVCIAAIDAMRAWIGTYNGKIYVTSNGGFNWLLQLNPGAYINDIKFSAINSNYGYIFSDPPGGPNTPFRIYKTTDSGLNWMLFTPQLNGDYVGAAYTGCVTDSLHFWFGLNSQGVNQIPKIAYTANGGLNWQTITLPYSSYFVSAVQFMYDNNTAMSSCYGGPPVPLFKTTNAGSSWYISRNLSIGEPTLQNLVWVKGTSSWFYCALDQVGKSTDNGLTWNDITFPIQNGEQILWLDAVAEQNKVYVYAVTNMYRIMRYADMVYTIGIKNLSTGVPESFKLYQNYPNPFNPSTKIKFAIPKRSFVRLKIFDILGREKEMLVNQEVSPSEYEVFFDGSKYSSGVYFYRITTGTFTDTKKMVIVK